MSNLIKKYPFLAWILGIALAVSISIPISTLRATLKATENAERYVRENYSIPMMGVKNNTDSLLIIVKDFQKVLLEQQKQEENKDE